jgi:dCTP deaminase
MSPVLSSSEIITEVEKGNIVINPINHNNIGNCSVDVTLGSNYYRRSQISVPIYNPWNPEHVRQYWGTSQKALTATEEDADLLGVSMGTQYILINPLETILAHTQEFIGGRNCITTMMKARSSLGRSGISICKDAGWGDIGYINRWTMEITNFSSSTVALIVGERIGQIVFYYTGVPIKPYQGSYQKSSNLEELIANWQPEDMLPKLYRDKV